MHQSFLLDKYLVNQKKLSLSEKYHVYDEGGKKIFSIVRPAHHVKNFLAITLFILCLIFSIFVGVISSMWLADMKMDTLMGPVIIFSFLLGAIIGSYLLIKIIPLRHIYIYHGETEENLALTVRQDFKITFFKSSYSLISPDGECLAKINKSVWTDILRKVWNVADNKGLAIVRVVEDSIFRSIARRIFGPVFGALRTNFNYIHPQTNEVIGSFNRKWTLFDKYVLDLSKDTHKYLDRRIALSVGVLLDTGENR